MSDVSRAPGMDEDNIARLDIRDGGLKSFGDSFVVVLGLEPFAHGLSSDHVAIALPIEGDVVPRVTIGKDDVPSTPEEVVNSVGRIGRVGVGSKLVFIKEVVGVARVVILGGTVPITPESAA